MSITPDRPLGECDHAPVQLEQPDVLIIEDNADVARTFSMFLEQSGMRTLWAKTGREAMLGKAEFHPQIVLVDMSLPDTNGVSLIRWLSQCGDCGIIIVSGAGEEAERVVGIELGADDYIVKPPVMRELVARIRAVHRRMRDRPLQAGQSPNNELVQPRSKLTGAILIGGVKVDLRRREIIGPDQTQELTDAECRVLTLLLRAEGNPVSREQLCQVALNRKLGFEDRSVDQLVLKIRRKLGIDDSASRVISSVRGAGYALLV